MPVIEAKPIPCERCLELQKELNTVRNELLEATNREIKLYLDFARMLIERLVVARGGTSEDVLNVFIDLDGTIRAEVTSPGLGKEEYRFLNYNRILEAVIDTVEDAAEVDADE